MDIFNIDIDRLFDGRPYGLLNLPRRLLDVETVFDFDFDLD